MSVEAAVTAAITGAPWDEDGQSSDGEEWESLALVEGAAEAAASTAINPLHNDRTTQVADDHGGPDVLERTVPSSPTERIKLSSISTDAISFPSEAAATEAQTDENNPFATAFVGGTNLRALLLLETRHNNSEDPLPEPVSPVLSLNEEDNELFLELGEEQYDEKDKYGIPSNENKTSDVPTPTISQRRNHPEFPLPNRNEEEEETEQQLSPRVLDVERDTFAVLEQDKDNAGNRLEKPSAPRDDSPSPQATGGAKMANADFECVAVRLACTDDATRISVEVEATRQTESAAFAQPSSKTPIETTAEPIPAIGTPQQQPDQQPDPIVLAESEGTQSTRDVSLAASPTYAASADAHKDNNAGMEAKDGPKVLLKEYHLRGIVEKKLDLRVSPNSLGQACTASTESENEGEEGTWEDYIPSKAASENVAGVFGPQKVDLNDDDDKPPDPSDYAQNSEDSNEDSSQGQPQKDSQNEFSVQDFLCQFFWQLGLQLLQDIRLQAFLVAICTGFTLQSVLLIGQAWAWIWFFVASVILAGTLIWFMGRKLSSWIERQRSLLQKVEVLRHLMLFAVWIPTLLEVRILVFLCTLHMNHASSFYRSVVNSILWAGVGWSFYSSHYQNPLLRIPPRHISLLGGVCLYCSALAVSLWSGTRSWLWLIAPLLSIAGMLLLLQHDVKVATKAHQALWRTLEQYPDHDKLVQLLVIKWLAEQWSTFNGSDDEETNQPSDIFSGSGPTEIGAERASTPEQNTKPRMGSDTSNGNKADDDGLDIWRLVCDMDLDEQVQPFLLSYKHAVQSFPPDRSVALWVALGTKTPALLVCLIYSSFSPMLLPFVVLEVFRVREWTLCCHATAELRDSEGEGEQGQPEENKDVLAFWRNADPMVILLSDENPTDPSTPTLLQMWWNLEDSVPALEMGLTTARCVQTTVAVVDLKNNLQVVADWGDQVREKGWVHGFELLFRDVIMGLLDDPSKSKYMETARNSVRNSQRISQNLSALSQNDPGLPLLWQSFQNAIVGGWGWLGVFGPSSDNPEESQEPPLQQELPVQQQQQQHGRERSLSPAPPPPRLDIPMEPSHIGEIDDVLFREDMDTPQSTQGEGWTCFPPNLQSRTPTFLGDIDDVVAGDDDNDDDDADNSDLNSLKEQDKLVWSMAAVGLAAVGAVAVSTSQRDKLENRPRAAPNSYSS